MGNRRRIPSTAAAVKRKPAKLIDNKAKKSPEKASPNISTIEMGFKRQKMGEKCPVCKKRIGHWFYKRHFEKCKLDEDDDEIEFIGTVQSNVCREMSQSAEIKNGMKEDISIQSQKSQFTSRRTSAESIDEGQNSRSMFSESSYSSANFGHETTKDDEIDRMPLMEVYQSCLQYLENFLGRHHSFSNNQSTSQWTQKNAGNKENFGANDRQENDEEEFNRSSQTIDHQNVDYTLRFVWKILQKVLLCFEHIDYPENAVNFWGESLRVPLKFLSLPTMTQQLFVFLLRRRWGWHLARDTQEKYHSAIPGDHIPHFDQLCTTGFMQAGSKADKIQLSDALNLLKKPDYMPLCKQFKVRYPQQVSALREDFLELAKQSTICGGRKEHFILKSIRKSVGEFFRIDPTIFRLFNAFFTVYSPTQMDSSQLSEPQFSGELISQLFFTLLQHRNGELSFPSIALQSNHSLIGVLHSYDELMDYIDAKQLEARIAHLLNHHPSAEKKEEAIECAKKAKQELLDKYFPERMPFYLEIPTFLRKFTAPWVLCRCISIGGIDVAQKLKNYELAVEFLSFLLEREECRHFCMSSRGPWYERLALNTEYHLKDPDRAFSACLAGLRDPMVRRADKLILQNRIAKMKRPIPRDVALIEVDEPERMEVYGTTLAKGLGDGIQVNHFYIPTPDRRQINKCSVEELALRHFIDNERFTHGHHTEGSIWHTLFRFFFNDIIFTAGVPRTWLSNIQNDPLDLNFPDFYANRKEDIDLRLQQLSQGADLFPLSQHLFEKVKANVAQESHIQWHNFAGIGQMMGFLRCCPGPMLHDMFRLLCTDYRANRSGFPDLTVWNERKETMAVVEVKGPNDSLSTKQQLWLHFFRSHGVRAVVCHVIAKNDRTLE